LDRTWHPECFVCFQCSNTFGDDGFHEKDGEAYCKGCYFGSFAPKCAGCSVAIMENYISSLDAQWCIGCFVCATCNQPFVDGNFFEHEGAPYCETHFHALKGSLCAGCSKPISGKGANNFKAHLDYCEDPARSCENLNFCFPFLLRSDCG